MKWIVMIPLNILIGLIVLFGASILPLMAIWESIWQDGIKGNKKPGN